MANKSVNSKIRTDPIFSVSVAIVAIFITATLVIISISTLVMAQNQNGGGWNNGYAQGRADRINGNPFNSSCDPNNGDAACAGYEAGYQAGWTAASILYGNNH